MQYTHRNLDNSKINLPIGKVVCVGRNYAAHARELNNPVPKTPLLFIKPATALVSFEQSIQATSQPHPLHYELEIAVLINAPLKNATAQQAQSAIGGLGLSLDLTFRDLQQTLKEKGHPWEIAKAFDSSCPTSHFVEHVNVDLSSLYMELSINGAVCQASSSAEMLVDIISLLVYSSSHFTLAPGDILLTGTPAGVGTLKPGDKIIAQLSDLLTVTTQVI